MRFPNKLSCLMVFVTALASPVAARAAAVHFDTPAEYEGQFRDNSTGPVYAWNAGVGVRGTPGRINVADLPREIPTALYRQPFGLSDGRRHEVSAYFLSDFTNSPGTLGRVGYAASADGRFSEGSPWLAVAVRNGAEGSLDYGTRFGIVASYVAETNEVEDVDDATPAEMAFSLFSGHWYKLTTSWTYGGGGRFDYDATFVDYGRTGTAPDLATLQSVHGSFVNAAFADPARAATMFAGVESGPRVSRAWDEFEARVVPEPGAGIVLSVIAMAVFLRRRRRS